jgi:hypothetical protein
MPEKFIDKCASLKMNIVDAAELFIWAAFILAVLAALTELAIKLAPLFSESGYPAARSNAADPVKLLDTLKSFIEALSKAPIWLGMLGSGLALLWALGTLVRPACGS